MRWGMRLMGLLSMPILARLLTPADYGIMAVAMVVYALLDGLRASGVATAVIRLPEVNRSHYDTAWTIDVGLGVLMAGLLLMGAPFAAQVFNEPAVEEILLCLAVVVFVRGMTNAGTIEFRRELQMGRHVAWQFSARAIGVVATIMAAFALQNYWALVIGMAVNAAMTTLLSFVMHPLRPRLSLAARREILGFSGWSIMQSGSSVLMQRLDQLVLAGNVPAASLGQYYQASNLSEMLPNQTIVPLAPVVMSAYSKAQTNIDQLYRGVVRAVGFASIIIYPIVLGACVMADDLVFVLLGDQWGEVAGILPILSLIYLSFSLRMMLNPIMVVEGRMKLLTFWSWAQLAALAGAMLLVFEGTETNLVHVALAKLVVLTFFSLLMSAITFQYHRRLIWPVTVQVMRPVMAALIMAAVVYGSYALVDLSPFLSVPLRVPLGGVVFIVSLSLIWIISGKPDGAERELVDRALQYGRRIRPRAD